MVVEDPNILGGAPVVRGTRIPVHDVAAALNAGRSTQEIQAAYSTLNAEQIELARLYASANPQRGRPSTSQRKGMELVSEKRVARRRRT
nr:DUF433 domain-containing protein [Caulobacter sp. 17J65-9]